MNQGRPSCGWKASCQAVHSVAVQIKTRTAAQTRRAWTQRILVAFMATKDQASVVRGTQAQTEGPWGAGYHGGGIGCSVEAVAFRGIGIRALRPGYSALTSVAR